MLSAAVKCSSRSKEATGRRLERGIAVHAQVEQESGGRLSDKA